MRTLRSRLLLGTALGTTLVLLLAGILLYALIRDALWHEFDQSLATKARSLAAMTEQENGKLELEFDEADFPEFRPSDQAEFYQVWSSDGQIVARSRSLNGRDLDFVQGPLDAPAYASAVLPDSRPGRIAGIQLVPRHEENDRRANEPLVVTLALARETAGLAHVLATLRVIMIAVGLVAVLVSVGVLAHCVRRGLRPVHRLAAQIGQLEASNLGVHLDHVDIPAELAPVIHRLNDLLDRLQSAFQRERRFSADVAHELRTPLAGLRSMLEVALSQPRGCDEYRRTMEGCLSISQRMQQMIENLLSLARADANQLEIMREHVDLAALVRECWKPLAAVANERHLSVNWHIQDDSTLATDRALLQLVLRNLLDNAVAYADRGGRITIECLAHADQVTVRISNTGSDVPADQIERVFDRFWRADQARQATGAHCGLGLALCKEIVTRLGGSISATSTGGGSFSVCIGLYT